MDGEAEDHVKAEEGNNELSQAVIEEFFRNLGLDTPEKRTAFADAFNTFDPKRITAMPNPKEQTNDE